MLESKDFFSNFDSGALVHRSGIAEFDIKVFRNKLEDMACYAGLLLVPAEAFFALRAEKELIMLFCPILGHLVVTLIIKKGNLKRKKLKNR